MKSVHFYQYIGLNMHSTCHRLFDSSLNHPVCTLGPRNHRRKSSLYLPYQWCVTSRMFQVVVLNCTLSQITVKHSNIFNSLITQILIHIMYFDNLSFISIYVYNIHSKKRNLTCIFKVCFLGRRMLFANFILCICLE